MKKVIQFFSMVGLCTLLAMTIIIWVSAGPPGPQATRKLQGIEGGNGNNIYGGTVTPSIHLGDIGDFYLHIPSSNFYGPKSTVGWGAPVKVRNTDEIRRVVGINTLSGTVKSTDNISSISDYYPFTTR